MLTSTRSPTGGSGAGEVDGFGACARAAAARSSPEMAKSVFKGPPVDTTSVRFRAIIPRGAPGGRDRAESVKNVVALSLRIQQNSPSGMHPDTLESGKATEAKVQRSTIRMPIRRHRV